MPDRENVAFTLFTAARPEADPEPGVRWGAGGQLFLNRRARAIFPNFGQTVEFLYAPAERIVGIRTWTMASAGTPFKIGNTRGIEYPAVIEKSRTFVTEAGLEVVAGARHAAVFSDGMLHFALGEPSTPRT